jgi:peptidoglycan/LPS O-acetylase OafA/YrhL
VLPDQPRHPLGDASVSQVWFVYDLPPVRTIEFVIGMLVARIVMTGRWAGPRRRPAALIVLAAYVISLLVPYLYGLGAVTVVPLALLIGAVGAADAKGAGTHLAGRRMVWLGEVSFAFYLVHGLVLKYGHLVFGVVPTTEGPAGHQWSTPVGVAFLVAAFALSLVLAWALHVFVEVPVMRRWSGHRAVAVPDPPAILATEVALPQPERTGGA